MKKKKDLQVAAVIMMRRAQWFLMSLPIVAGGRFDDYGNFSFFNKQCIKKIKI